MKIQCTLVMATAFEIPWR